MAHVISSKSSSQGLTTKTIAHNSFKPRRALGEITNSNHRITEQQKKLQISELSYKKRKIAQVHIEKKQENATALKTQSVVTHHNMVSKPPRIDNIDARDAGNELCVTEYVEDMYKYFREKEQKYSVKPTYMKHQRQINEGMRSIVIDWLIQVHLKHKMAPETLFLMVSIIDRYLRKMQMSRAKLQLLGATALLLASKYEEIFPFAVRELVFLCDGAYSKEVFIAFETHVLQVLGYKITVPSAHSFLVRYLKAGHANRKMIQLSRYILDGTLQSYKLMEYLPSELAAASVMIARSCIGRNKWSSTLASYTEYSKEDILPIAHAILSEKAAKNVELISVNQKYMSDNYGAVAETVLPTIL
eukprot:scaffold70918_cov41-Attheya_sp.AAC.1